LGYILLLIFCGLEFFNSNINGNFNFQFLPFQLILIFAIAILIALSLFLVNEKKSKYYTSFWVESIPIIWWFLAVLAK
jgi:small-conductance mechanosensitive channel